jgi:hypothetical protein
LTHYQPELADETIDHLAQVSRYALRKSEHEWTLLGEEVEFITVTVGGRGGLP